MNRFFSSAVYCACVLALGLFLAHVATAQAAVPPHNKYRVMVTEGLRDSGVDASVAAMRTDRYDAVVPVYMTFTQNYDHSVYLRAYDSNGEVIARSESERVNGSPSNPRSVRFRFPDSDRLAGASYFVVVGPADEQDTRRYDPPRRDESFGEEFTDIINELFDF